MVVIGGGSDDHALMRIAAERAGGAQARIAVLPLASRDPGRSGPAYVEFLSGLGLASQVIQIPGPAAAADPGVTRILRNATLLFFSGGDQSRIVSGLARTAALRAIGEAWRGGAVLAGTSAGAMPWGSQYIAGGTSVEALEKPSALDLRPGLGLAGPLLVDTHFTSRSRLGRLLVALSTRPGALAIGVDEGTAAVLDSGTISVAGAAGVAVVEGMHLVAAIRQPFSAGPFKLHRLTAGRSMPVPGDPQTSAPPTGALRTGAPPSAAPSSTAPSSTAPSSTAPLIVYDTGVWTPHGVERLLRAAVLAGKGIGVGLTALATASVDGARIRVRGGSALILDTSTATEFAVPATPSTVFVRDVSVSVVSPAVPYDLERHAPAAPTPAPWRR